MLAIEDLRVDLPDGHGRTELVRGLDLTVQAGRTLAIVGESGSGKSITALAILGLLPGRIRRQAARLSFDGRDLLSLSERQLQDVRGRDIGMIFQDPTASFNPTLTVGRQLEEVHLRHFRQGRAMARARAMELLGQVGIPAPAERMNQYPFELSGGLRQRAMIAMALMCGPKLLIADEPTTALDVTVQAQVLKLLRDLQRRLNLAVLLITHDLGVVSVMADEVAVMYGGEIVERAPVDELLTRPLHPYSRGLLACVPQIEAGERPQRLATIRGHVPARPSAVSGCGFAERCDFATPTCTSGPVRLRMLDTGHLCRCVRATRQGEMTDA